MKETIVTAMLCAVLAGMAVLWRPAGDKAPRRNLQAVPWQKRRRQHGRRTGGKLF